MSMVLEMRAPGNADVDYGRITQLSSLGSLADGVLRELIELEAGHVRPRELSAIPKAASMFRVAAEQVQRRRSIWDAPSVADQLVYISSLPFNVGGDAVAQADAGMGAWLAGMADSLHAVASGESDPQDVEVVRDGFSTIARATLRSAAALTSATSFLA